MPHGVRLLMSVLLAGVPPCPFGTLDRVARRVAILPPTCRASQSNVSTPARAKDVPRILQKNATRNVRACVVSEQHVLCLRPRQVYCEWGRGQQATDSSWFPSSSVDRPERRNFPDAPRV